MGCWGYRRQGGYQGNASPQDFVPPWANWKGFMCGGGGGGRPHATSGNHAFDEYRMETLRRLEDEQKEFSSFLERLRFAKDKAEFDQFMAERRQSPPPAEQPTAPPQG